MSSTSDQACSDATSQDRRLLIVLERLLALDVGDLSAAMAQAAQQVADVLGTDKVDVFFYASDTHELIAEGTSDTRMGRRQKILGLDRLPARHGGRVAEVFETGQPYSTGHADQDPLELPAIVHDLGVRSMIATPVNAGAVGRGVLVVSSATVSAFTPSDIVFVGAVGQWIGLTSARLAHAQLLAAQAAKEGMRYGVDQLLLTARQRDVAALIRAGLTNSEIAQQLVLNPGTVANHVANILDRLGFRSRTQIALWAAEHGLDLEQTGASQPIGN